MQHFVSAQVYAMRSHSVRFGRPSDHWGFAWAPRNAGRYPPPEWAAMTGSVLDRLATAIRDSALETPADPGCGRAARTARISGAPVTSRRSADRQVARVPHLVADDARVRLAAAGRRRRRRLGAVVPAGAGRGCRGEAHDTGRGDRVVVVTDRGLATSAAGPFTPTLTLELPAGAFATAQLYYQDATAGTVTLTASAAGVVTGTQQLTVTGAAPLSLRIDPSSSTLLPGATAPLTAVGSISSATRHRRRSSGR